VEAAGLCHGRQWHSIVGEQGNLWLMNGMRGPCPTEHAGFDRPYFAQPGKPEVRMSAQAIHRGKLLLPHFRREILFGTFGSAVC
jgi:hypothetical protein